MQRNPVTSLERVTEMTGMSNDDAVGLPRLVRPGEAAALIAAYAKAQRAELGMRWLLALAAIPVSVAEPVANVDVSGRSVVLVLLSTTAHAHMRARVLWLIAVLRSVIESGPLGVGVGAMERGQVAE